jgi:nicotinate-nucleotide adenylyltransferase
MLAHCAQCGQNHAMTPTLDPSRPRDSATAQRDTKNHAPNGPIVLFGGTFDPIHFGHLRVCLEAGDAFNADEIWLLPAATPPNRGAPSAGAAPRAQMLERALEGQSVMRADLRELLRQQAGTPSYTIDTLREVRVEIGPIRPLIWLMGADQLARLESWKDWQRLLDFAHLGVLSRPDADKPPHTVDAFLRAHRAPKLELTRTAAGHLASIEVSRLAISSTKIRALLAEGRSPRYLLPNAVLDYIQEFGLYQPATS